MSQQIDLTWASNYLTKTNKHGMRGEDLIRRCGGGQEGLAAYLEQLKTNNWEAHHKFMNAWGAKKNRDKAKKEKKHTLTFTMTASERQQLKKHCKKAEMTIEQYLKNAIFNLEKLEKNYKKIIADLEEKHVNEVREINLAYDLFGPENITKMAAILEKLTAIEQQNKHLTEAIKKQAPNNAYTKELEKQLQKCLTDYHILYTATEASETDWLSELDEDKKVAALTAAENALKEIVAN